MIITVKEMNSIYLPLSSKRTRFDRRVLLLCGNSFIRIEMFKDQYVRIA